MAERLVDVTNDKNTVLHTFPVTVKADDGTAEEKVYKAKAAQAAAFAQLVPPEELPKLDTKMHVSRGGQLTPFGDALDPLAETPEKLENIVRDRAYYLWLSEGCPQGREDELWARARDQHFRERAYVLWEQEGRTEGKADDYWHRAVDFES